MRGSASAQRQKDAAHTKVVLQLRNNPSPSVTFVAVCVDVLTNPSGTIHHYTNEGQCYYFVNHTAFLHVQHQLVWPVLACR